MEIAKTSTQKQERPVRKRILLGIKFVVTAALCGWIIAWVNWQQFWSAITLVNVWIVLVVLLMRFFGLLISTYKGQSLLAVHGLSYRLKQLFRWYHVSMFLNNFLPTSIGGDAYRIYKTWSNG